MRRSTRLLVPLAAVALALLLPSAALAAEPAHAFVGSEKCKMCHNSAPKGAQFTKWSESAHAKAYATLASEESKKIAAAKGIADPQKADECLRCHVTGNGAPAAKLTEKYKKEEGVSCESCHGPGGDYWKMDVMKDMAKATAAGLVMPTEETCKGCHNAEGPTFKGFDFAAMKAKIAHPNPQKAGK
jgi:nitrate/TMAO reductase-like tetraheme cytochrome c subunit